MSILIVLNIFSAHAVFEFNIQSFKMISLYNLLKERR